MNETAVETQSQKTMKEVDRGRKKSQRFLTFHLLDSQGKAGIVLYSIMIEVFLVYFASHFPSWQTVSFLFRMQYKILRYVISIGIDVVPEK